MRGKNSVFKFFVILSFFLAISFSGHAKVSQAVADSIANLINHAPTSCDQSCALYNQEHPGTSITNTIFIALLLVLGSVWLYFTYKKKYIIIIGSVLAVLVVGSYFARPLFVSNKVPANCPIVVKQSSSKGASTFVAPGNEFAADSTNTTGIAKKETAEADVKPVSQNEFSQASSNEFASQSNEFQAADSSTAKPAATASVVPAEVKKNYTAIYEPIAIFLILGLIGWLIRYPWFRQIRGVILLGGLLYLGFFRSACPCMISGFQNSALALFGVKIAWESLLWFLVLIPATYLFGKVWCGWLCHLGALQEFLYRTPKLKLLTSGKVQRVLKIIQISVFTLWILQLLVMRSNLYCEYDPFKSAFNLMAADWIGYLLLGILLLSSVLIYRPFCRTTCPVGLVLGWVALIPGARKLNKNDLCIDCISCNNECKQRAIIHENRKTILRTQDCILCGECFHSCKKDALKVKRHSSRLKIVPVLLILLSVPTLSRAQWECPSRLGGSLQPIGQSNLMWAGEVTTSAGTISNQGLANAMVFGGLDYSVNNNTFYVEGGFKSWYRFDSSDRSGNNGSNFGLREAFYRNSGNNHSFTLGLQSTKSDDYFLVNERMVGANYRVGFGNFSLNLLGGSVLKEFARNGTFCTLGYLYNVVSGRDRAIIGNSFGQTNLAMASLTWKPKSKDAMGDFASNDGLGVTKKPSLFGINSAGLLMYHEFGNWTVYNTIESGVYADINLLNFSLKPEVLLQSGTGNNALIYSFSADKQISWGSGQLTKLFGRYVGMHKIDATAIATPSFSNIFAGEVLRLDALDMPFFQAGIKHSFPSLKASIKLQGALQTGTVTGFTADDYNTSPSRMKEFDLTLSKNIGKFLLINATAGYVSYPLMTTDEQAYLKYIPKNSAWGKVELRFTF